MAAHGAPPPGGGRGHGGGQQNPPTQPAATATPPVAATPPIPTIPPRPVREGVAVDFDFRAQDMGIEYTTQPPVRRWVVTIYAFDGHEEPAPGAHFQMFFAGRNPSTWEIAVSDQAGKRGFWSESFTVASGAKQIRATLMEGGKDRFLTLYGVPPNRLKPFLEEDPLERGAGFWENLWRGIMGDNR